MLDAVLEHLPDAVYVIDPETSNIIACNRAAWKDLGLSREAVLNHSVLSLQKDVGGMPHWNEIATVIRENAPYTFIGRHVHANGGELPVEIVTSVMQHQGQEYFISVARNISRRVTHEQALKGRPPEVWTALHDTADGVWDWEVATGHLYFSPQLKQMLGYGPDEMKPVLSTWKDNVHPDDAPLVLNVLNEHLNGRRSRYEAVYRLRNRNGHYLWVHDRGKVCQRSEGGEPTRVIGMVHNITDLKNQELELQRHAEADSLTNLINRRRGEELAAQQLKLMQRLGKPLGLCMFDLDHFKQINDLYGHLVGDEVLQGVANCLRETIRESDIVFRWGGEEFVLICPNTSGEALQQLAEKVRRSIEALRWPSPLEQITVTASLGLAEYPRDGEELTALIAAADTALYDAKASGRNRISLAHTG
ncbi:MAG: sensor domain-containing diguanylate cyclase [Pseudomonadota bacterium]